MTMSSLRGFKAQTTSNLSLPSIHDLISVAPNDRSVNYDPRHHTSGPSGPTTASSYVANPNHSTETPHQYHEQYRSTTQHSHRPASQSDAQAVRIAHRPAVLEPPVSSYGPNTSFAYRPLVTAGGSPGQSSATASASGTGHAPKSSLTYYITPRPGDRGGNRQSLSASTCVGQQQFPGLGLCYVYDDGTICPTVVDGENVDPRWGITKAGKARKRLAQACLYVLSAASCEEHADSYARTCRKKKIRCEPTSSGCVQCTKARVECATDNENALRSFRSAVLSVRMSPMGSNRHVPNQ